MPSQRLTKRSTDGFRPRLWLWYNPAMSRDDKSLQEECRRFAAETGDPEVSRILHGTADDLERYQLS
jgi:hypothetical protein